MKRYSEDQVPKMPEKRSLLEIMPENPPIKLQIQNDLLYDVLYFLERKEIEKKRLVSKQWNYNILTHDNILPLLTFGTLSYTEAFGDNCWNVLPKPTNSTNRNPLPLILENISDSWLKNLICEEIIFNYLVYMDHNEIDMDVDNEIYLAGNDANILLLGDRINDNEDGMEYNEISSFRKIMKNKDAKIKVIKASFFFRGTQTKTNVAKEIEEVSKLLNDHIDTTKLLVKFVDTGATSHISDFTTATFNKPYESITLDFTLAYFNENVPVDIFLFIGNRVAKYYLLFSFSHFEMADGESIISNFMKHQNPEAMIHKMSFIGRIPYYKIVLVKEMEDHIEKIILQNKSGIPPFKNFKDFAQNEDDEFKYFKIHRKDGWILHVAIPHFKQNDSLEHRVLEFTIEK